MFTSSFIESFFSIGDVSKISCDIPFNGMPQNMIVYNNFHLRNVFAS